MLNHTRNRLLCLVANAKTRLKENYQYMNEEQKQEVYDALMKSVMLCSKTKE